MAFESQLLCAQSSLMLVDTESQKMTAAVLKVLLRPWETQVDFLHPDLGLMELYLL